ncbi:MAG: aspartate aminotransferase family protein [Planctomycetaceae bacterium]
MNQTAASYYTDKFATLPTEVTPVETAHRRITTPIPAPETLDVLAASRELFPRVNQYQPPIVWDRAEGFQVFDAAGNCWIDFSSTAVMTNTGHGHPAVREAVARHAADGLLAQFTFPSQQRVDLARKILDLSPPGFEKVYFWTAGSEAVECALRLVREFGRRRDSGKDHVLTHAGDYHGWTLGATQLSGRAPGAGWLSSPDQRIHHLPFPGLPDHDGLEDPVAFFDESIARLAEQGVTGDSVAAVFLETFQGWGGLAFPTSYILRLREWADAHDVLLVFDEIQTGFGRTGRWFGHEHYDVTADLVCVGKGLTSSLPLAAVLGRAEVMDLLEPAEITTTHAGHPVSCAAALANLEVIERENLVAEADRKGELVAGELARLQARFPDRIERVSGRGLMWALHVCNPQTREPDHELTADWTWAAVCRGVMLFHTMLSTVKVVPPLVITDEALVEGIGVLGEAMESLC